MKNLSQDSRFPGRDLKPGALEYEAGMLTTTFGASMSMPVSIITRADEEYYNAASGLWLNDRYQLLTICSAFRYRDVQRWSMCLSSFTYSESKILRFRETQTNEAFLFTCNT
jgi:hypothetical protein